MAAKIDRSDILAILAVIVSLSALVVALYETSILRDQSALMQEQQKASVWPYLEMVGSYYYNEFAEISIGFKNKGVGPAKIKSANVLINGQQFKDFEKLQAYFMEQIPEAKSLSVSYSEMGGVMSAGAKATVFFLKVDKSDKAYEVAKLLDIKFEVCYCSIYDDCFRITSEADEPRSGCD